MTQKTKILLTGATGYIGSHAVIAFEEAGYETVILDNFSNSSLEVLHGIKKILGYQPIFYKWDIRDKNFLQKIFRENDFDGVIHFAGLKSVWESMEKPFLYHENNIFGTMILTEVMNEYNVKKIIFSSSATVYSAENIPPFSENAKLGTSNPYGTTKLATEFLLSDLAKTKNFSAISLRYFNPIGAHSTGHIGENPNGIPNNLLPYIFDVASGKQEFVQIFGNNYPTKDGTGERDYIDVCDLVDAHILAYKNLEIGHKAINIWTGSATSVLEMIRMVEKISGKKIPYKIVDRRPGDLATVYCVPNLAKKFLKWEAIRTIEESILNGWKFISSQK